jgi:4-hydroxy-tetrahydrodipicolinate synthase
MLTPFRADGSVDDAGVSALTTWYMQKGCDGIFAVCQSSEIFYLTLEERVRIATNVVKTAREQSAVYGYTPCIVGSGHVSDDPDAQAEELCAIAETGVDAVVWITNRLAAADESDAVWIKRAERLLSRLPSDLALGMYECPYPYKRLLSPEVLRWCVGTGRFRFIKDTCCDPILLKERLALLEGTGVGLFNANTQTLLHTLRLGAAGFSGVMGNFHPEYYTWLCRNYASEPEKAERLQAFLTLAAASEAWAYPVCGKYHLQTCGLPVTLETRTRPASDFTPYYRHCVDQLVLLEKEIPSLLGLEAVRA